MAAASGKTEKAKCGATNKQGNGTCKHPRGFRTDHPGFGNCWLHGGSTQVGETFALREQVATIGARLELAPHDALLDALYRQAAVVAFYAVKVSTIPAEEMLVEQTRIRRDANGGTTIDKTNTAEVHVWIRLYEEAVLGQAKLAKAAVDAGVAERHVRVIEAHAELFARAIDGILGDLGLTEKQLKLAAVAVPRHLRLVESVAA